MHKKTGPRGHRLRFPATGASLPDRLRFRPSRVGHFSGIAVGFVNIRLIRVVVMPRLGALVDGMRMIETVIENATRTGDWTDRDPEIC